MITFLLFFTSIRMVAKSPRYWLDRWSLLTENGHDMHWSTACVWIAQDYLHVRFPQQITNQKESGFATFWPQLATFDLPPSTETVSNFLSAIGHTLHQKKSKSVRVQHKYFVLLRRKGIRLSRTSQGTFCNLFNMYQNSSAHGLPPPHQHQGIVYYMLMACVRIIWSCTNVSRLRSIAYN